MNTQSIIEIDAEIISNGSRDEIHRLHREICAAARTSLSKAIRIGELLTQRKATLQHGKWLPWLEANVEFTYRTAGNYIRLFEHRNELKLETISNLTDAYRLLAGSDKDEAEPEEIPVAAPEFEVVKAEFEAEPTRRIYTGKQEGQPASEQEWKPQARELLVRIRRALGGLFNSANHSEVVSWLGEQLTKEFGRAAALAA